MTPAQPRTVLHYTGYNDDRGGIMALVRALAGAGRFGCVLGVNAGCIQHRSPPLPTLELPGLAGEKIGPGNFWRARAVARAVQAWLRTDASRVFHGHSRAGLLVGWWLHRWGERRVVVSVHCYGRQRWFYRWAARQLGARLYWLSPAMKQYYGIGDDSWTQCIPGGVPAATVAHTASVEGSLRLGGIGALVRWKGWATVIEALALLSATQRARVTFEHIGTGDETCREELVRLAEARGVAKQFILRGAEPSSQRLLGVIDALVVASVNEPFSLAMLEALAAGIPVLAAGSGGARDIIREGVNGRLYPTGDATALAGVIGEWLARPPSWPAGQIAGTSIPIERVAAQWAEVYAAL